MNVKKCIFVIFFTICTILLMSTLMLLVDNKIVNRAVYYNQENFTENVYSKKGNNYFQITQNYVITEKEEIKNILFTALNYRWDSVKFQCSDSYVSCFDDFTEEVRNEELMSALNNYVHPFYQYKKLKYHKDILGTITIDIKYIYSKNDINEISEEINKLNLNSIEEINNYVINNAIYSDNTDNVLSLLILKKGNCKAITDFVNICLFRIKINSYAISNSIHAWNAVIIDNKVLNLDATWNILSNNKYFLIEMETLNSLKEEEHYIDDIYYKF